jgi:ATP-dependent helicase/nuclease subunit B
MSLPERARTEFPSVQFLLGPAGAGKTWRCVEEIRAELQRSPEGPALAFLAPNQATFQLERRLLAGALAGYTRLHILSFNRLAGFVLDRLQPARRECLGDEGRLMVLRALLAQRQGELKVFRATARLPGFARHLSLTLREFQQSHLGPADLARLLRGAELDTPLRDKLHDLALLIEAYMEWLEERDLEDSDQCLDLAAEALNHAAQVPAASGSPPLEFAGLWLDGFAELTPQEIRLLAAVVPLCHRATLAFCLDTEPRQDLPWLSTWSAVGQTFRRLQTRLAALPGCRIEVEVMARVADRSRFTGHPRLADLERRWAAPVLEAPPAQAPDRSSVGHLEATASASPHVECEPAIRLVSCGDPEAESVFAAREIRRYVREQSGRFRDTAVLVRSLEAYHDPLRRVFLRYDIPFFLDRREPVAHHPLAELTRLALRTVAFHWQPEDWLGVLKTGLLPATDEEIDELENVALARGWRGDAWLRALAPPGNGPLSQRLDHLRVRLLAPFRALDRAVGGANHSAGTQLAQALRDLWRGLGVEDRLYDWSRREVPGPTSSIPNSPHATVWDQMQSWVANLERAFRSTALSLREWLPVVEAGLAGLTVGVIPPALDQVLIGTIDRSRNPDLKFVFVLGLNESVFPAPAPVPLLLSEADRAVLERDGIRLGPGARQRLGHERYFGYIAFTRAAERLILTFSRRDAKGRALNPSPFLAHLQHLFPRLSAETFGAADGFASAEHPCEVLPRLFQLHRTGASADLSAALTALPGFAPALDRAGRVLDARIRTRLDPALAEALHGRELCTSVTGLEEFAACPFRFFVMRGLRAGERKEFEIDARDRGSFQHAVLQEFHRGLHAEGRRWRDLSPDEAQTRIREIGERVLPAFRGGLFAQSGTARLNARLLIEALQRMIAVLVGWMTQYEFDPAAVEVGFGLPKGPDLDLGLVAASASSGATEGDGGAGEGRAAPFRDLPYSAEALPGWTLDLGDGHRLTLRGRIDRVDLCPTGRSGEAWSAVLDYKSSERRLDAIKLHHGLALQLPAYLCALAQVGTGRAEFGGLKLIPAGAFYVNLRGSVASAAGRLEAQAGTEAHRTRGYQHAGRFRADALGRFDNRQVEKGDQFKYRRKKGGGLVEIGSEALSPEAFAGLLNRTERFLRQHGLAIFAGDARVAPYRQGQDTACDLCPCLAICRFDPWVQGYRALTPPAKPASPETPQEGGDEPVPS